MKLLAKLIKSDKSSYFSLGVNNSTTWPIKALSSNFIEEHATIILTNSKGSKSSFLNIFVPAKAAFRKWIVYAYSYGDALNLANASHK